MKAKLFTKDLTFIDVIDISQISFKRQRNKEYTISCKPVSDVGYNWEQVSFVYFLDDNEEKTKRIQYKPCGYLEGYNGDSLSIKSMESYLESISVIPENFEWWQNKLLKNVLSDLCYGFRRIKKASLSEMQDVATSYHVKFDVLENGNGEVYADTGYYFSPSNTHELYYYSDGYVIYRMTLPAEARRQGLVLRWSDQTGTTTDVSVQFRWSNVSSDFTGTYSAEQSPLRGEGSRKNETVGVDVPESDNTYLFIKFNLKYDTGSTSVFPKGYNYEQEITTVQGEGEENYVYYGKTAILNAFEIIYRVDTRIEEGTISVSDTQLMQADLSNCNSLLSVLKAISEAYKLTFFVSFEENIPLLNVYNEYINDTTNQTIITDKVNSTVTRKEIKTETLQAVEAFGIGNGFDRIHAFVKADDLEANIKNIGKYEGEETSVEDLVTNAKAYIEKENEELSSASFEYYNMPLQVNDKVRVVINKNVYTSLITEENYSFDGDKTKKEYTIGIRKYAFSGFFTSPFSGLFLYKPEAPTNLIATRMEQGWTVSWQGRTQRYILQYRRSSTSPWNTISVTGTNCTIPFTEYDIDYTFAIYAVDDRGQYSDAMYIYSNSSSEAIYVWETYHDGDTQPDTPTGSGNTGGWHRDLTQNAKWVSKKEAHRITEGSWSVPVLTSNGVRLGVLDDTPDDVTGLTAVAMKDGIQISCNAMGVGAKNVVSSFEFELLLEGESEWIPISSFTNSAFYTFNRSTIGYPEASDLDGSQVRCKVKNTYNYYSTNYATASVNTDTYGTWYVLPPDVISTQSANRAANVTWQRKDKTPLGKDIYGISFFDIQISMNASTWYKPAQGKTGKVSEDDWKDGTGYLRQSGGGWSQSLPLTGQTLGLPVNTTYYYRVRTRGITDDYLSAWSDPVTAIALATGIGDIIAGSVTEQILAPDAVTYEKLNVLAVNKINSFVKGKNDYWTTSPDAGTKNCTIETDAETGLQCGVFSTNSNYGITYSNKFEVLPDDILEVNITVFKDIAIGTTYIGLQTQADTPNWNCQYANYNTIAKSWGTFNNSSNFYFLATTGSTTRLTLKTYIVGYNVTPDKIPAPNLATACARMLPGQTKANLRILNYDNAGSTTKLYILAPRVINIASGQILAKQIVTPSLSAIDANIGEITSGILRSLIKAGESKPNVFLDLDKEEFRVGNNPSLEDSNHEDAEYLHWIPNFGLFLKLKNLIVDALASTIRGRFRVRGTTATMAQSVLIVNPESTVDPDTNTPANTTVIKTALRCPAGITGDLTGKSKDSYPIPTDAVLQYSFDEIKQLPDNPAGTVYKRDNDWTTVDGWYMGGNATLNVQDGYIRASRTSTSPFGLQRIISGSANKLVVLIIRAKTPSIVYCARPAGELYAQKLIGTRWTLYSFIKTASIDDNGIYIYTYGDAGSYFDIKSIYIGDGSYLDPVIDNSYSEAHAENHGVIPVDGVCGKAGYFNNSYMIAPRPALGDDITIYFWAKYDALGTQAIVQSRTALGTGLAVYQYLNGHRLYWRENRIDFTGYTLLVNTWHHVCIKMNATTAVLKINGELKSTLTGTYGTTANLASTIWAGKSGTGGTPSGSPLTGALDGLKIVPRYTTDDEDIGEYKARANHPKFYATADKWKTARNITISDADGTNIGTAVSVDGSENETLKLPAMIKANLTGNATNGFTNIRRFANFTLPTYSDGTHISVANTHATNTITCILRSGQTMNGQSSFTIAPDTLLEFELIGTAWKCVSNEPELIWANPNPASTYIPSATETTSGQIEQFKSLIFTFSSIAPDISYQHSMEVILTANSSATNLFVGYKTVYKSREVSSFSGNSVQFSSGYSGGYLNNGACVPIAIYGVK